MWLHSIRSPTFVFEGADESANIGDLRRMQRENKNEKCRFFAVKGANHFNLLSAESPHRRRIAADKGPKCKISLTAAEVDAAFQKDRPKAEDE